MMSVPQSAGGPMPSGLSSTPPRRTVIDRAMRNSATAFISVQLYQGRGFHA